MQPILRKLLALSIALTATAALACSPVQQFNITFPDHSAALDTKGALRLGNWMVDLKVHFPNYSDFFIFGEADSNKQGDIALATKRSETVRQFLMLRGFPSERVHVERARAVGDSTGGILPGKVVIQFLPACPHHCCNLPTHKVKDLGLPMP